MDKSIYISENDSLIKAEPLRVGVIGCGAIAQGAHLPIIQFSEFETLQAVCDIKPKLAHMVGERYGALKIYTRIEDILNDSEVEAVIVSLYHDLHYEVVMEALRRGKHVLIEKPMTMSYDDSKAMVKEAAKYNLKLVVGYMWRYDRGTDFALQKVKNGEIGEVNFAICGGEEGAHGWEAGALKHMIITDEPVPEIKMRRPAWCEGSLISFAYEFLMDCGSHTIDLLRLFLGEPEEIIYTDVYRMHNDSDDFHTLRILSVLRFPSARVVYNIAFLNFDITGMSLEMRSDTGSIKVCWNPTLLRNKSAVVIQNDFQTGDIIKQLLEPSWCFENEHESFVRTIRCTAYKSVTSAELILPVHKVCEAMMFSWLERKSVNLYS